MPTKDKIKTEAKESSPFQSPLHSPAEGVDDSNDELSSLVDSPSGSEPPPIGESGDFAKMSVYSPSQEQFSIPENIGTEAQTSSSLSSSAVSDIQGAKHYISESEYPVSSSSETSTNFYSPSTSRSYSFSQPSMTHSPLVSPSTYSTAFNPQAFTTGGVEGMMTSAMYPNGACMSPSAYMSPYGSSKQYTWPTTPNAYGTFGMNTHDLMQAGYATAYPPGSYSQMTTMSRTGYPATYFPPQVNTATTHAA